MEDKMKLKSLLKKALCFGMAAALSLGIVPAVTVSAAEYPGIDMFAHVQALNGNGYLKGVQGVGIPGGVDESRYAYTDSTGTHGLSHAFLNADLDKMIFRTPVAGAEAFSFEGNTYYFNFSNLESFIQYCNSQGLTCNIQFMLVWNGSPDTAWLVEPQARVPGVNGFNMYAMDVSGEGRQAYRAFWRALMQWCAARGYHIDDFILGNEVNAPNTWNYFGTTDVNTCTEKYAISFLDMYQAVREYTNVSRCSICLDHSWTWDNGGTSIGTKAFMDNFHTKVTALNGGIPVDWCLSMHLWPARLDWATIWKPWNGLKLATNSINTFYVDGSNLKIMTDYIKNTFGASHRVMMTEQGFVRNQGDQVQAASLAYTYYACLYDDMVDSFILHDSDGDGQAAALSPLAQEVFQKIGSVDAADQQRVAQICLPAIGVSSWSQIIRNFGGPTGSAPAPTTPVTPVTPVTPTVPTTPATPSTPATPAVQTSYPNLRNMFDAQYYADTYPDLKAAFGNNAEILWTHFINCGLQEGRAMSGQFDVVKYRNLNADLNAAFGDNWDAYALHYQTCGINEGRIAK